MSGEIGWASRSGSRGVFIKLERGHTFASWAGAVVSSSGQKIESKVFRALVSPQRERLRCLVSLCRLLHI